MSENEKKEPDFSAILASVVAPRPLAWITVRRASGLINIAPFNSFTGLANYPPLIGLSFSERDKHPKDTLAAIESGGQFVVNVVTRPLAERMNESAREAGDVDDFERLGLTPAAIDGTDIPRISESPAAIACRVESIMPLPPSKCRFVIARVIGAYTIPDYDPITADTLTSIGVLRYGVARDAFTLPKNWG